MAGNASAGDTPPASELNELQLSNSNFGSINAIEQPCCLGSNVSQQVVKLAHTLKLGSAFSGG
jgi:hypothetical protein